MSETKTTRKQLPAYLILALIALAAALLLAVTNAITAGPIKAHEEAAQNAAFQSVMTADSFSTMSIPDGCNVTSLVEAKKDGKTIGYCAVSSAKGYGGNVAVTLGVDMDGKIVGCQIGDTNFAETDGFGARWKEPARAEAFIGLSAFGGDTIEAITGATVTSKAVLAASNDVLKCISHVLGKDVEGDVLAFGVKEEKPVQTVELTGDVHQGKAVGFGNGEVTARLTLNDDGTIAALVIDASTQTPGFGTRCADEEFTAQFIGKSGPFTLNENVDGLTGATITSTAAVEAINAALTSPAMAAEDLEPAATEAPMVLENAKTATIAGFGGADITVQVTDENGVITALVVDASSQTAGFGQKCAEEAFTSQFIGKSAPLTLGDGIDAVASATITSQAVVDAVNSLYAAAEPVEEPTEAPAATEEPAVQTAEVKTATAAGYDGNEITVNVTDENGVITSLTVDASTQTAGLGQKCAEEAFTAQFIGKSAPLTLGEGIDAVASATITSQAVVDAVNSLYAAAEPVEEPTEAPAATEEPAVQTAEVKTATAAGYDGNEITVNVTDENGVITSLTVDASTQTAGLGQKCAEEAFTAQFIGKSAPLTLGEGIDAVASATITSQAIVDAVNSLYAEAPAKVLTTKVKGWHEGVAVTVEIDKNHVITALTVDASGEFYALGGKCADEAFTSQFIGKSAPLTLGVDIDAVTGATLTSQAVVDAVNQLAK